MALEPASARRAVLRWFAHAERPLPWRATDAWGVLVSEFMLQQTPVDRVLPVWVAWRAAWPRPDALAAASRADVLRAWGRLGYPRRAVRLHEAAAQIVAEHGGVVPDTYAALRALPGVGDYTAAAVLAFAYGQRSVVLDINVRRVLHRAFLGNGHPPGSIAAKERELAESLLPREHRRAARWNAAVMELGALLCSSTPRCDQCPLRHGCAWRRAGSPEHERPRAQPRFAGSDRQVRGLIMAALREADGPMRQIDIAWPTPTGGTTRPSAEQRDRAIESLVADGLIVQTSAGWWLPG